MINIQKYIREKHSLYITNNIYKICRDEIDSQFIKFTTQNKKTNGFILYDEENIIGFILYDRRSINNNSIYYISVICINSDYKGYGKYLLNKLFIKAQRNHISGIKLTAIKKILIEIYKKYNFIPIDDELADAEVELDDDSASMVMVKILNANLKPEDFLENLSPPSWSTDEEKLTGGKHFKKILNKKSCKCGTRLIKNRRKCAKCRK